MSATLLAGPDLLSASWTGLGCRVEVLVLEPADFVPARRAVEAVLDEVDRTFSRFREDSELSILNRAPEGAVPVSPLLARALRVAIDAADWTDGLVDPTIGQHLLDLGYDRTFSAVPGEGPDMKPRVRPVRTFTSLTLSEPDDAGSPVLHRPPGVRLDLGATGKGLAADLAADAAVLAGARGVLVNLGGDISVAGDAPSGGWPVFVTDVSSTEAPGHGSPSWSDDSATAAGQTIALSEGALATSGTSRRRWRRGGVDLHHIIDPATGLSAASPWRTVSVAAQTCVLANAAATAGVVRGLGATAWLSGTGLAARLVAVDGEVIRVGGWPS
jgi:thiamine biosynthesis lipoprotein